MDLRSNPKLPSYGRFGGVFVRFGKASRGSSPKRRTVLTVPEMDWIVEALESYLGEVRPCFRPGRHPALWVTERCGRLSKRSANEAFTAARDAAGLPQELDLHSLRTPTSHTSLNSITQSASCKTRSDIPMRAPRRSIAMSPMSTGTDYSVRRSPNAALPLGRINSDQEDGLSVAAAGADGAT